MKPRIPVTWEPAPACLEFVDRSADPVYRFEYSILDEDPSPGEPLLPDEVADSRRHQFFAFPHQRNQQTEFPHNWISLDDVAAAVEKNLITDTTVGPEETLDTSPLWQGNFVRITPDDQRRPIAHESVASPVEWDTSTADPGVYMLWGYTWEPAFNEWAQRYGNVVIVHDGDPSVVGPAAVITNEEEPIVYSDEAAVVEGCVFAEQGTTIDAYFAETPPNGAPSDWQPTWVNAVEGYPVRGDTFAVEFMPGGGHSTPTLLVRLVFNDPSGRSYEAHMPFLLNVIPGSAGGCETDGGGGFIGMPGCGGTDGTDGTDGSDAGSDTENESSDGDASTTASSGNGGPSSGPASAGGIDDGGSGGTCAVDSKAPPAGGLLLLLGLLGLRRRHS